MLLGRGQRGCGGCGGLTAEHGPLRGWGAAVCPQAGTRGRGRTVGRGGALEAPQRWQSGPREWGPQKEGERETEGMQRTVNKTQKNPVKTAKQGET